MEPKHKNTNDDELEENFHEEYVIPFKSAPITIMENRNTTPKLFLHCCVTYPDRRAFGTREYLQDERSTDIATATEQAITMEKEDPKHKFKFQNPARGLYEYYTYADSFRLFTEFYFGLKEMKFKRGDKVGIISPNRVEWCAVDIACCALGVITVPLYDTQSAVDMDFVCKDSGVSAIFSSPDRLSKLIDLLETNKDIKDVIIFDDRADDRTFVLEQWDIISKKTAYPKPQFTSLVMRSEEECNALDKKEKIADPIVNTKASLKIRNKQIKSKNIYNYNEEVQLYDYKPSFAVRSEVTIRSAGPTKSKKVASLVTATFHQICTLGRNSKGFKDMIPSGKTLQDIYNDSTNIRYYNQDNEILCPMYDYKTTKPDDLLSLVYTSGTTGKPKGVMITTGNLVWTSTSMQTSRVLPFTRQDSFISFLPMAHIFQRALTGVFWRISGCSNFWCGTVKELMDDFYVGRPTILVAVPRILQKVFDGIVSKIEKKSPFVQFLFNKAYESRRKTLIKAYQNGKEIVWPAWTNGIFKQTKAVLGGRVRECVTGSAPLIPKTGEFLKICCDMLVFEGWGMTETSAHGAVQPVNTINFGAIGVSLDSQTQIKLVSIPEMGYRATDNPPKGEVWIKGPSIFKGYYNDPVKTREALTEDGWFKTGDIGTVREDGELCLIDRKKSIFKTAQGEFISVGNVENKMGTSKYIDQCFMYGSRYESFVQAVVVPKIKSLREALPDISNKNTEDADFCADKETIKFLLNDINETCRKGNDALRGFEVPKALIVESDPWTTDNNLLTPALKNKRPNIKSKYEPTFMDIYRRIEKAGGIAAVTPDVVAELCRTSITEGPLEDTGSQTSGSSSYTGLSMGSALALRK